VIWRWVKLAAHEPLLRWWLKSVASTSRRYRRE
jgi:hypothetical protein